LNTESASRWFYYTDTDNTILLIIIIIIIIIIINCNLVVTRWQRLFYMYTMYKIDKVLLRISVLSTFGSHRTVHHQQNKFPAFLLKRNCSVKGSLYRPSEKNTDYVILTCHCLENSVNPSLYTPLTGLEGPRFPDNRHMKVVRLSALRTGRLYSQEIFLVLLISVSV
jgi:hypothetical protein